MVFTSQQGMVNWLSVDIDWIVRGSILFRSGGISSFDLPTRLFDLSGLRRLCQSLCLVE